MCKYARVFLGKSAFFVPKKHFFHFSIFNFQLKILPLQAVMRYHVAHIEMQFAEPWQQDLFEQQLFDLGFDTLDESDAYIPTEQWELHRAEIEALCEGTEGVCLVSVKACPDEDWNAAWENEHPMQDLPMGVRIIPHCAFGAGHHETTSMMIDALMAADLKGKNVLDHGTGTGVLAIFAKRLGAAQVVAVDIDDKAVENARENAALNGVELEVQHTSDFSFQHSAFSLILANIHRNILLAHMPEYASSLCAGGELWISGFYDEDCPALIEAAGKNGLTHVATFAKNEWRMIKLNRKS